MTIQLVYKYHLSCTLLFLFNVFFLRFVSNKHCRKRCSTPFPGLVEKSEVVFENDDTLTPTLHELIDLVTSNFVLNACDFCYIL